MTVVSFIAPFYRATLCYSVVYTSYGHVSVRHMLALNRIDWKNQNDYWHEGFLSPILHCVIRTFGCRYLQNNGTFLYNFVPNSGVRKFRHGKSIVLSIKLVDG